MTHILTINEQCFFLLELYRYVGCDRARHLRAQYALAYKVFYVSGVVYFNPKAIPEGIIENGTI